MRKLPNKLLTTFYQGERQLRIAITLAANLAHQRKDDLTQN